MSTRGGASRRGGYDAETRDAAGALEAAAASGGASAAAKTSGLGHDSKVPADALETARREVKLEPMPWWRPANCVRTHFSYKGGESV